MKPSSTVTAILFALALTALTGCAMQMPVQGEVEVVRVDPAELPRGTLISVGPRRLLEAMMNKIATSMPSIMPVDGLLFRDTAFPQGGWLLRDLLDEKNRTRIAQQLQVDYLVLVGPFEYTKGDWTGPTIVIAGADTKVHKASLSATIYDLRAGTPIARIVSTALGNELLFSYVILMSGSTPHVVTPMLDAMVKAIAETISKAHPHASTRIAVLAAEMPEPNK